MLLSNPYDRTGKECSAKPVSKDDCQKLLTWTIQTLITNLLNGNSTMITSVHTVAYAEKLPLKRALNIPIKRHFEMRLKNNMIQQNREFRNRLIGVTKKWINRATRKNVVLSYFSMRIKCSGTGNSVQIITDDQILTLCVSQY